MLTLRRWAFILVLLAAFAAGAGSGALGHWWWKVEKPRRQYEAVMKQEMERLNRMVRRGEVVAVKPQELTVKILKAPDASLEGKTATFKADRRTTVQRGSYLVGEPGRAPELDKYLKPGMEVDLLVDGDRLVAIHWDEGPPYGTPGGGPEPAKPGAGPSGGPEPLGPGAGAPLPPPPGAPSGK